MAGKDNEREPTLIVGAASGIGAALARMLAAQGETLILADRREAEVSAVAAELAGQGGDAVALPVDLADPASVEALLGQLPPLRRAALVAGICEKAPALEVTRAQLERMLSVNYLGIFQLAQGLAAGMVDRGHGGSLVAVTSGAAKFPLPTLAAYAGAKAAVTAALKVLALEVAAHGVRINCVLPGPTRTPMLFTAPDELARDIPLGRINEPEDIANVVAFLLSDQSAMMTMRDLSSDGGQLMGLG